MNSLMQRVSTAEEGLCRKCPLTRQRRRSQALNRAAGSLEKKVRQDMKKRAELAFEEMETELMAAIRQDPELKDELHGILLRAKEKVLREDG